MQNLRSVYEKDILFRLNRLMIIYYWFSSVKFRTIKLFIIIITFEGFVKLGQDIFFLFGNLFEDFTAYAFDNRNFFFTIPNGALDWEAV